MSSTTKREIVSAISHKTGMIQADLTLFIDAFLEVLIERFAEGKDVSLRGFGSFEICVTQGRVGRNPKIPGSQLVIPPHCKVRFRPGRELRTKVRQVDPSLVIHREFGDSEEI
jgi:nucleoid DNA-binding protein